MHRKKYIKVIKYSKKKLLLISQKDIESFNEKYITNKIFNDDDFIWSKEHMFSLKNMLKANKVIKDKRIIGYLRITSDEYEKLYNGVIQKFKKKLSDYQ